MQDLDTSGKQTWLAGKPNHEDISPIEKGDFPAMDPISFLGILFGPLNFAVHFHPKLTAKAPEMFSRPDLFATEYSGAGCETSEGVLVPSVSKSIIGSPKNYVLQPVAEESKTTRIPAAIFGHGKKNTRSWNGNVPGKFHVFAFEGVFLLVQKPTHLTLRSPVLPSRLADSNVGINSLTWTVAILRVWKESLW